MRPSEFWFQALRGILFVTPARAQNIHINSTQGNVAVLRGDADQPVERSLQATLVTGDRIVTGEKSQAEVQIDAAHTLQIGPGSEVRLGEVYPGRYQMVLGRGGVTWRVAAPSTAEAEVVTPSVSVRPRAPGVYTIAINNKGESEIAAKEGVAEVFAPTGSQWIPTGTKMLARGPASDPEFQIVSSGSKWRRFLTVLSSLQIGGIVPSFGSNGDSSRAHKPQTAVVSPSHGGNQHVAPPESGHSPSGSSHNGHSSPQAHTAPAAAASAAHSAPASASSAPASHGK
jgi:hypothetical protein